MDYKLDLTPYSCPIPLITLKKVFKDLQPKALQLQLNKQTSLQEIEQLAIGHGYSLIRSTEQADFFYLQLQKSR